MSGMGTGLNTNNPTIVSAFHAALIRQGFVVFIILAVMGLAWNLSAIGTTTDSSRRRGKFTGRSYLPFSNPEPAARRLLRVAFGLLWIFDGILQAQASMPLGMASQVLKPAAATSPIWVQHLDELGRRRRGASTPSPRRPRRYGSRSASVSGSWPHRGGTGHGLLDWEAWGGA